MSGTARAACGMATATVGVGPSSGKRNPMDIDVVQLHIVIALGVVALAARVADRDRRPPGSALSRFSPARLLLPLRRRSETQSTTPSRSISIIWLGALVMASGQKAIGLAEQDRDHEWARTRKPPAVEAQPQTASSGNRESHT